MYIIEPSDTNLRYAVSAGVIFGFVTIAAFSVPALLGVPVSYFEPAFNQQTPPDVFSQSEWLLAIVATGVPALTLQMGAFIQLLLFRLLLPKDYAITHMLMTQITSGAFTISVITLSAFMYAELYAVESFLRQQAILITAFCFIVYALLLNLSGLLGGIALFHARSVPPLLGLSVALLNMLGFLLSLASFNPNWPAVRMILGLLPLSITGIIVTAYCWRRLLH